MTSIGGAMRGKAQVRVVAGKSELECFIRLPSVLTGRRPNYVPPLWSDEKAFHDPGKNPGLAACDVIRFMAYFGELPVGRIMGIVHRAYNELKHERTARFYQLDCIDDAHVCAALVGEVENWAVGLGMDRVIGPFGLSDKDPQGLQVEGFEHLPVLATPTNPSYLPRLVEALGYVKFADAVVYRVDIPEVLPEIYGRISDRVLTCGNYRLLTFTARRQLEPWIMPVLRLVNETYQDLLGFVPMSEDDMRKLASQYMPVLDPAFVKIIVDRDNAVVAFVVGMPDMSEGFQRAQGRLLLFGWWHILRAMRRSRQLDLFLGAVRKDLQGRGLTGVLGFHLLREAKERGLKVMDSHLVLETNQRMRAELERLGGTIWKRYRVYSKAL